MIQTSDKQTFNAKYLSLNSNNEIEQNGFNFRIFHNENDPDTANRIKVSSQLVEVEILPSKGFSLGQAWVEGKPLFWEAPIGLPDTETIDLWSDEVCINGKPAPGFTFLKTLVAGIELYGLKNWGMPVTSNGLLHPLHGETSNIPVGEVQFEVEYGNKCVVEASFLYRSFEGDLHLPWYERGAALFKVTRKVVLFKGSKEILIADTIENISNQVLAPDWGYHVTFRPEEGAKYLVPSKFVQQRNGNPVSCGFETWHQAEHQNIRTETGIIHKELLTSKSDDGSNIVTSLLVYPNNTGIAVSVPSVPYFQTWFCHGGKNSKEFTFQNNESLLKKNWDGMGIEFGSSPLDHNGNLDATVMYEPSIKPGEIKSITIKIENIEKDKLGA